MLHQNGCGYVKKGMYRRAECLQRDFAGQVWHLSLRLFGSTARDEQNSDSDVDVFVETQTPNPFLLMEAKDYLEASTGRSVDIVRNHRNLNPRLKKRIERDEITVF